MLVVRWNVKKEITLEQMQNWKSVDMDAGGFILKIFDGVCAATSASYLLHLIIRTILNDNGNLKNKFRTKKSVGEIIIMEADDTGERCMDRQPIVKPTRILFRMPVADEFLNWKHLKDATKTPIGTRFREVRDLLEAAHPGHESAYNEYMKKWGHIPMSEEEGYHA